MIITFYMHAQNTTYTLTLDDNQTIAYLQQHIRSNYPKRRAQTLLALISMDSEHSTLKDAGLADQWHIGRLDNFYELVSKVRAGATNTDEDYKPLWNVGEPKAGVEEKIGQLLLTLTSNLPDLKAARQLLVDANTLVLNLSHFMPRTLHNLLMAIQGNLSLKAIRWWHDKPIDPSTARLLSNINKVVISNDAGEYPTAFQNNLDEHIKKEYPQIAEHKGFRSINYQPRNLFAQLFAFKLRINILEDQYLSTRDTVVQIVNALNTKYAYDLYTHPLQAIKFALVNQEYAGEVTLCKMLLQLQALENLKGLLVSVQDVVDRTELEALTYDAPGTIAILTERLNKAESNLEAYLRLFQQAQFTLYPGTDHNFQDIRLLFLVRDIEIALHLQRVSPSPAFIATDSPIGNYVSYRQALSAEGMYVPFGAPASALQEIKAAQEQAPLYLFLKKRTYPAAYDDLLLSLSEDGIGAVCSHYLHNHFDKQANPLLACLIQRIKIQKLSLAQIIEALDSMLLTLSDGLFPIHPDLVGISFCVDAHFPAQRAALVRKACPLLETKPTPLAETKSQPPSPSMATLLIASLTSPNSGILRSPMAAEAPSVAAVTEQSVASKSNFGLI